MNINTILSRRLIRHLLALFCLVLAVSFLAAAGLTAVGPTETGASSHREAPLIRDDPTVDNLDVYAFVSPDLTDTVTLIATWIPFEEPGGGPNFYHFDPTARYLIKIDQDGDAVEDITYEWTFEKPIFFTSQDTYLYNTNQITNIDDPDFNLRQYYTVTKQLGTDPATVIVPRALMPPDNLGPRSLPDYKGDIEGDPNFVKDCGSGCKEFTGQRDDPFFVDVGSIFDLGGLRPFNSAHILPPNDTETGQDVLRGFNTHATAIQVPISDLVPASCTSNMVVSNTDCVIGVWSTAERPAMVSYGVGTETGSGDFVQVSRLGNPLVNEVVMSLELKDTFNAVPPSVDRTVPAVVSRVLTSELASLINFLYPATTDIDETGRTDLQTVFLTGIPGLNQQTNSAATPSEQLRLNVAVPPTADADISRTGPMGNGPSDLAGWPNGRRLTDDVVDIAIRAVAQGYGGFLNCTLGLPNLAVNNTLGDGVDANDQEFLSTFPYLATPYSGYENNHDKTPVDPPPGPTLSTFFCGESIQYLPSITKSS